MKTQYKEGDVVLLNKSPFGSFPWDSNTPDAPDVKYFKSRSSSLLIKTTREDGPEIELAPKEVTLQFVSDGLGPQYYLEELYDPITREEFDDAYKKIVDNLNKFASL